MKFAPRAVMPSLTPAALAHLTPAERSVWHLAAVPLDDEAETVGIWPVYPSTLCGRRRTVDVLNLMGRQKCQTCADEFGVIESSCSALERYRARLDRAAQRERTAL